MLQSLWKTAGQFLKKVSLHPACDPVILYLSIYLREMKAYGSTKTRSGMFTAALCVISPNRKEPKCPPSGLKDR